MTQSRIPAPMSEAEKRQKVSITKGRLRYLEGNEIAWERAIEDNQSRSAGFFLGAFFIGTITGWGLLIYNLFIKGV